MPERSASDPAPDEIVTRWHGAFRVRGGRIVERFDFPAEADALRDRLTQRLDGGLAPEEEAALRGAAAVSRDRRLRLPPPPRRSPRTSPPPGPSVDLHRELLLAEAERRLQASWDPSVHVDEAVRTIGELDHVLNLLGERLVSWAGRDGPPSDEAATAASTAHRLLEGPGEPGDSGLPAPDPALTEARARIATLYESSAEARRQLETSIEAAMPRRAPNLSALLGPLLAARMIAQAGGLDRLARLPASTVQVLGAEKAFFEHLRGRAPPPRHGFLFLHPEVQSAPRRIRGRVARALAGKVAIAARMDREGSGLRADLVEKFRDRARAARAQGAGGPGRGRGARGPT